MMNIFDSYADKENVMVGRPVVKGSDVDKVKRNLALPLKPRNQLDNNANTPMQLIAMRKFVNSPITELANNFTELAAHEISLNNTPKRRLSLASSSGSPTPDIQRVQGLSSASKSSADSSTSLTNSDNGSITKSEYISSRKALETRHGFSNGAFRRFKSMPFDGFSSNEASPQLQQSLPKLNLFSPPADQRSAPVVSRPVFSVGDDTASHDSHDSGIGKDEGFKFIAPSIPPERTQAANEQSPVRVVVKKSSHVIGSPDLHDSMACDSSDSPLLAHTLCGHDENTDDGFGDLDALEGQCDDDMGDVPVGIAGMLTASFVSTSHRNGTDTSGSLHKTPSVPQKLNTSKSFDLRRRVFCGKRPEPPRDNNTPVAANKKRRSVVSDGNMPPVPCKLDDESSMATTCAATRLQRCKSMVEHSTSYELNNSGSDKALTGDFEKSCCLPLVNGKHQDLRCISHETMADIVNGKFEDKLVDYTIIDCRYPYEYDGGHIKGAENIYIKGDLYEKFLSRAVPLVRRDDDRRSVLIFHCEFSSERAPRLSRFLRNHDREKNQDNYPSLYYPEVYLLEGGYKVFYEHHKELCVPEGYVPMLHKDHSADLKKCRAKSKSWSGVEKRGSRTGLMKRL